MPTRGGSPHPTFFGLVLRREWGSFKGSFKVYYKGLGLYYRGLGFLVGSLVLSREWRNGFWRLLLRIM